MTNQTKEQSDAKPKCSYCGRSLVPIANARANGTTRHQEWTDNPVRPRTMHKQCFKRLNAQHGISNDHDIQQRINDITAQLQRAA